VIDALNADLPFDEFTIAQLAGDMLPKASQEQQIATGFHRNTLVNEEGGTDKEQFRVEAVVDRVSTVGNVWLGLSVGCARCHDHKYDPVSQREFYQLFALLNNCEEPTLTFPTKYQAKEEPALLAEIETFQKRLDEVLVNSPGRRHEWERSVRAEIKQLEADAKTPEVLELLREFTTALDTPENQRTEDQTKLIDAKFYPNDVERASLEKQLADLNKRLKQVQAKLTTTLVVKEIPKPRESYIHIRGDFLRKGAAVEPGTPAVLPPMKQHGKQATRLDLARWLVDEQNPLTPRVTVNRVWQQYFGTGLVATENDFGTQGERPTHPELLDWLATEFVRQGWSIKKMHRLMMLSRTYQMASRSDEPRAAERDAQNRLLHRMPIRRLEAEAIRDSILAVSGRLDAKLHGPSVMPHLTQHMTGRGRPAVSGPLDGDGRRSIYINVRRNFLTPMLLAFDYPLPFTTIGKRSVSNVPAQALALMNNPFVVQQSETWSKRVLSDPKQTPTQRVATMYVTAFGRPPSATEVTDALAFVTEQSKTYGKADDPRAWADLCHVMFNVKEFIFVN